MCMTCVADEALAVSRCKSPNCPAWAMGYQVVCTPDNPTPNKWKRGKRRKNGRILIRRARGVPQVVSCFVRAVGKASEFEPAKFQVRGAREKWGKTWMKTNDLAGAMAAYGFDVTWRFMPPEVQEWLLGKRAMPSLREVERCALAHSRKDLRAGR